MKITLISVVHVWVNPRLVKEADALTEQGHEVTVVTVSKDLWSAQRDRTLLKAKPWKAKIVDLVREGFPGRARWFFCVLRQKFFFQLSKYFKQDLRCAAEAYCRGYAPLLGEALRAKADLYIAHTQGALPIAARAAGVHGVPFGFDCEDLNAQAMADGLQDPQIKRNIQTIEKGCLSRAAYVSATSIPMAEFLVREYSIKPPLVIHNVFPKKELQGIGAPAKRASGQRISLVWMSATIGKGRGLIMAIQSLKALPDCELHVYGRFVDVVFEAELKRMASEFSGDRTVFHPLPASDQVMKTLAGLDVGLALDDASCLNLSLTICNKFFLYLQAGLAVAATDIPGQKSIMEKNPEIGFVIRPDDSAAFIKELRIYCADRAKLLETKQKAWDLGMSSYNWDAESKLLVGLIGEITAKRGR